MCGNFVCGAEQGKPRRSAACDFNSPTILSNRPHVQADKLPFQRDIEDTSNHAASLPG